MKVLLIGNGGREDALAWSISKSKKISELYIAPGNGGTLCYGENIDIKVEEIDKLKDFALEKKIDLTVVGPEVPLTMGIVDVFENAGLNIVGPNKAGAKIEGSKDFAKSIMNKYGIPTASYKTFSSYNDALNYVDIKGAPIVIKADGLAAGKGVTVAFDIETAKEAIKKILVEKIFGDSKIVIEEYMEGEEASLLAFTDSETVIPMVAVQDHKRIFDGDKGPNTGGMGTYAPAPVVTKELNEKILNKILIPTISGLKNEGINYKGIIYAGLMIKDGEAKVVEFNSRFGDPETQVILPLLKTDILDIFDAIVNKRLKDINIEWYDKAAVCVVLASLGYPDKYEKGKIIFGIDEIKKAGLQVFHAGTKKSGNDLITNGGRVLNIVSVSDSIKEAVKKVYENIEKVSFEGKYYRKDIAYRAIKN